jgi:PAS domain S-box-containing protein
LVSFINPALAKTVGLLPREIIERSWMNFFPMGERRRVEEAYSQALLMGKINLQTLAHRSNGTLARVNILIVTVHNHNARLVGHYCMMDDRSREMELEEQIQRLSAGIISSSESRDSHSGAPSSPLW